MTITYKNSQIHFASEGSENPLVLLHGFLESSLIWSETIRALSPRRQIITIDLPGHGKSDCLQETHSMEAFAKMVVFILCELGIEKADILGHSMGGYVALAILEEHPQVLNRIILLNSTPSADNEERKQNRRRSIALAEKNKRAFVSMAIANLLTQENNKKFKEEIQALKNEALQFSSKGITKALEAMMVRKDRTKALQNYAGEKIIIAGEQDPILDYKKIKELAQLSHCQFFSLPDGHLGYLENKDDFLRIMHFIE